MVLPPSATLTFAAAVLVPLIIGFLVGVVIKSAIKIGLAIAVIVLLLIGLGIVTPDQVLKPVVGLISSGSSLAAKVREVAGYLPYSSVTFLIGLAIGFFR